MREPIIEDEPPRDGDEGDEPQGHAPPTAYSRDRLGDLRKDLRRQQRTGMLIAVVVLIGVGLIATFVSHLLLRRSIANQVRGGEVVERLRAIEADAQRSVTRIANMAEDADGKLDAALKNLAGRSAGFDKTVDNLMQKLADNAASTKRGFQIQVMKFRWSTGQDPVKMIHANEGVCFIYHIRGNFAGVGEAVTVDIAEDGYWWIHGQAVQQLEVGVMALRIVPLAAEEPKPDPNAPPQP